MAATNTQGTIQYMGYITSSSGAAAGKTASMISLVGFRTNASGATPGYIEFRMRPASAGATPQNNASFRLGLSPTIAAAAANNSFTIYYSAADGWGFSSVDNAGNEEKDTGLTALSNTMHTIRFVYTSTSVKCYVDGTQYGTTHSTRYPDSATTMYLCWFLGNNADAVNYSIYVTEIRGWQKTS